MLIWPPAQVPSETLVISLVGGDQYLDLEPRDKTVAVVRGFWPSPAEWPEMWQGQCGAGWNQAPVLWGAGYAKR